MILPPDQRREKAMVFGPSGSGKSSCWVSIADWYQKTRTPGKVRVVDTDQAWEAMRSDELDRVVEVYDAEVAEFPKWVDQLQSWRPLVQRDDWAVVDMVDTVRAAAENHYWSTITGGDMLGEIYLRAESEGFDTSGPYGKHQGNITKLYNDFMRVFLNLPCHKLALAPAQEVMVNKDGRALNQNDAEYVRFKYKPVGHWRTPHNFHTILLTREVPGEWNLTTVKERGPIGKGRPYLTGEKVTDSGFVGAYLMKVAGWRLSGPGSSPQEPATPTPR